MKKQRYQYKHVNIHKDFISHNAEFEQYALLYSKELQDLFATSDNITEEQKNSGDRASYSLGRYVRISYCGKVIYRKCRAECHIHSGEVGIGFRTQKELGLDISNNTASLCLKKSNFLSFYLHNSDRYIELTAWIAIIGFLLTLVSAIISVLSIFVQLPI